MTGYGKSILELENGRLTFEIKTVNGKNADINIKSQILPKDKELIVRQYIAQELHRGIIVFYDKAPTEINAHDLQTHRRD